MTTKIGLLRGINVGGKNKIKMAELREVLSAPSIPKAKRLTGLQTYIQSGNLVFDSDASDADLEKLITLRIKKAFGFEVPVFVRTKSFFEKAAKAHPFAGDDTSTCYFTFLAQPATAIAAKSLTSINSKEDLIKVIKDIVFLSFPNGYSKTKFTNGFLEKHFGKTATSRNWRTVSKLIEMAKSV